MDKPVNILIFEDNPSDAELMKRKMKKAGFDFTAKTAQDKNAFLGLIETYVPDIILADYSVPGFDGLAAMEEARKRFEDIPVIIVSGAIGEEFAIECLKAGATDYVLKDKLARLGPVIERALKEAEQLKEKRQAEQALRKSEREKSLLLDSIIEIIAYHDTNHILQWANNAYLKATGLSLSELKGKRCYHAWGLDKPCVNCPVTAAIETGKAASAELTPQNQPHWPPDQGSWIVRAAPVKDDDGNTIGAIEIAHDITEERRAQEAIRQSEERLRLLVEAVKDYAIYMLDTEGRVLSWNEGAQKIKQWRADEIIGRDFSVFYTDEDKTSDKPGKALEIAAKEGRFEEQGPRLRKDGSVFWADVTITAVRDDAGKLKGFAKVVRDITERKQAEEHLDEIRKELERSNGELEQFAYVASHDLREPLRGINGFMELLRQRSGSKLDEKDMEYIKYATDSAIRMDELITCLLRYSRVKTHGMPFSSIPVQLALGEAVKNLKINIAETEALITSDELPTVKADGMQLTQLFQNLIANAIKFHGDQKPEIHIGCQKLDSFWQFSVRDNGIGIEPQFKDRIFVIFQRLHTRDKYPGYGIGLSICKRIVERHGGRIWVESQSGKGSTFYFTTPI